MAKPYHKKTLTKFKLIKGKEFFGKRSAVTNQVNLIIV